MGDIYFLHNFPKVEKIDYDSLSLNLVFFNKDFPLNKKYKKFSRFKDYEILPTGNYTSGGVPFTNITYDRKQKIVWASALTIDIVNASIKYLAIYEPKSDLMACLYSFNTTNNYTNFEITIDPTVNGLFENDNKL